MHISIKKACALIFLVITNVAIGNFHRKEQDMSLIHWRPFNDLESVFEFRPLFKDQKFDMYQEDGNVIVVMHIPGFDAEDIAVEVENNTLYISAEQKEKKEIREKDYYHKEIKKGSFSRAVSLPCPVDEDSINAELHNGVLTITMPKVGMVEKETRKIKVQKK